MHIYDKKYMHNCNGEERSLQEETGGRYQGHNVGEDKITLFSLIYGIST